MHLVMVGVTAPSHTYPSLALIRELVARGHDVDYLVGDWLTELVAPTGANVVAHASRLPKADAAWPIDIGAAMQLFLDEQIDVLPRVTALPRPDAVLYDIGGYAGRVAAIGWGVPAIQLSPASVAWDGYEAEMAAFDASVRASETGAKYYADVRRWLDDHWIAMEDREFLGRPEACVALIPRALQPHAERVDGRYAFTGPDIDAARIERPDRWAAEPGDERPLVYVALGTAYNDRKDLYRAAIDGLAGDHRVVIATGKVDPDELGLLPDGVVVARTQPQLDVLHHSDVFVTHAGMGSAGEALWFGVPTVTFPQAVDQFQNAELLDRAGVGVRLADDAVTADGVRAAVVEALGRTDRARALRDEVRTGSGSTASADAVERFVAEATNRPDVAEAS